MGCESLSFSFSDRRLNKDNLKIKEIIKKWWNWLRYEPTDPRLHAGGAIRIAAIGGGTGLATLLSGLKKYSKDISAIVTVADNGASTGVLRKEFDIIAPGDIRKCISALAEDEELVSNILGYRFPKDKKVFGGHTLGNIWLTGLSGYLGSFEKSVELTTELFRTAGKVLPATLDNINLVIKYKDGTHKVGESHLDNSIKEIDSISLNNKKVKAYKKAVNELLVADLILLGPGSLYGSLIPNLLIPSIRNAIKRNKKAVKIYIANCSTERTQTAGYTIEDHIRVIEEHSSAKLFDYCLVNNRIIKKSDRELELGQINNISTDKEVIRGVKIFKSDVISPIHPLFHDSNKLAFSLIELYNSKKR